MKKTQVAYTLGFVCFVLTVAISIQLKTIKNTNSTVTQSLTENGLRDEVIKWKEKYDHTYKEWEQSEKRLDTLRQQVAQKDDTVTEKSEEIKRNNILLGLTDITGQGVTITLKDNQNVSAESIGVDDRIENYLVHDDDLRAMINELKNAGAEAISINDQRIVINSSITCEGNIIKINGQKIGSPFTIKAIGSPELLANVTRVGGYLEILKDTGVITEFKKSNNINILKYSGVIPSEYIKTVNER